MIESLWEEVFSLYVRRPATGTAGLELVVPVLLAEAALAEGDAQTATTAIGKARELAADLGLCDGGREQSGT